MEWQSYLLKSFTNSFERVFINITRWPEVDISDQLLESDSRPEVVRFS